MSTACQNGTHNRTHLQSTCQYTVYQGRQTKDSPGNSQKITLTADEVAKMLGMSKRFVYELAQRGELPCRRFGRKVLFSRLAIENMMERGSRYAGE